MREEKKDIAATSPCLCGNLRRAGRLVTKVYDTHLAPIDIKVTQYTMLLAIQRLGPVAITALADDIILERTTCTRNLKILETKKLVLLRQGPDKRMKQVALTPLGTRKIKEARPLWQAAQREFFQGIGDADILTLIGELTRLIARLRPA